MRTLRKWLTNFGSVTLRIENQTMLLHHRKLGSRSERVDGMDGSHYAAVDSPGMGITHFCFDLTWGSGANVFSNMQLSEVQGSSRSLCVCGATPFTWLLRVSVTFAQGFTHLLGDSSIFSTACLTLTFARRFKYIFNGLSTLTFDPEEYPPVIHMRLTCWSGNAFVGSEPYLWFECISRLQESWRSPHDLLWPGFIMLFWSCGIA